VGLADTESRRRLAERGDHSQDDADIEELLAIAGEDGGDPHIGSVYHDALHGFSISATEEEIYKILESDKVEFVEENQIVFHAGMQEQSKNTPWGLDRIDQKSLPLDKTFHYPSAGSSNVNIYVIDSGLDVSHPEFRGKAICGRDMYNNGCRDAEGHGTHVAGTAGGETYGVAKHANLIGVRVLGDNGRGSISTIIAGVDWVTQERKKKSNSGKAMIANLSIEAKVSRAFNQAVTNGWNAGVVMITAAGNAGKRACSSSPASADKSITAASTNKADERAWFSNYGSCVDIFAPGEKILSSSPGGKTKLRSGTSMSVPHVSGAAAFYMEQNVKMTPDQVRQAILKDGIRNVVKDPGWGSPNILLSIQSATSSFLRQQRGGRSVPSASNNNNNIRVSSQRLMQQPQRQQPRHQQTPNKKYNRDRKNDLKASASCSAHPACARYGLAGNCCPVGGTVRDFYLDCCHEA